MSTANLLVIMSDEHQACAMGCAGHPFVQTPNLDALAERGTRFANAYTPCSICVPARASFATGRYVHQTRLWDNAMPYDGSIPGWGHSLQAAGVSVESIGKLHYRSEEDPAGFDIEHIPMNVVGGVGMVWASIRREDERITGGGRMLGDYVGPGNSKYTDYDRAVTERAAQWLQSRAASSDGHPWCLYVGLVAPHFPLVVPQQYFDLYPLDSLPDAKLHPDEGHPRHPWVEKQNELNDTEAKFEDEEERLRAIASYYGLCSWLDHNVGAIMKSLQASGMMDNTIVVYTSDHGDNVGARGLWGKSNLYMESVAVPMIMAGPGVPAGTCNTPVSLLDLSKTITAHFGAGLKAAEGMRPLDALAREADDPERIVFSEYHAAGAVSGAFMLKKGRWKYHFYIGFPAELFDLQADPEETVNLADDPAHAGTVAMMDAELRKICDPEATDARAFADQAALIERLGGREAALKLGAAGATPPPEVST
ncbi:MAG: sulfatase-like hydrolase/transferase [Hyphomicrobiales bacterium]|nr:sulfatase-like hydrolase/transferase [Hyphomicrobiales bacterium]MCP5001714.1 sulfatase-like hydrolase/transferase [Hyphomicrobiales bacterium]